MVKHGTFVDIRSDFSASCDPPTGQMRLTSRNNSSRFCQEAPSPPRCPAALRREIVDAFSVAASPWIVAIAITDIGYCNNARKTALHCNVVITIRSIFFRSESAPIRHTPESADMQPDAQSTNRGIRGKSYEPGTTRARTNSAETKRQHQLIPPAKAV